MILSFLGAASASGETLHHEEIKILISKVSDTKENVSQLIEVLTSRFTGKTLVRSLTCIFKYKKTVAFFQTSAPKLIVIKENPGKLIYYGLLKSPKSHPDYAEFVQQGLNLPPGNLNVKLYICKALILKGE